MNLDLIFAGLNQTLDTTFAGFDQTLLSVYAALAQKAGEVTTPFFTAISWLGSLGAIFIILGIVLLLSKKTRKAGVTILVALAIGALLTDVVIKELIVRDRPYADANGQYYLWWQSVGAWAESSHSFPSGHTTAAMAAMTVVFLSFNKRISWLAFVVVILMGASRNYLMVHYPSDIIGGIIVGGIAGILAYLIVGFVCKLIENRRAKKSKQQYV